MSAIPALGPSKFLIMHFRNQEVEHTQTVMVAHTLVVTKNQRPHVRNIEVTINQIRIKQINRVSDLHQAATSNWVVTESGFVYFIYQCIYATSKVISGRNFYVSTCRRFSCNVCRNFQEAVAFSWD